MISTLLFLLGIVALPAALGLYFRYLNPSDTGDDHTPRWMILNPWSR